MADGIYVGMNGAAARAEQLDAVADNLANAQTPGFKSATPAFATFFAESARRDVAHAAAIGTGIDLRPGVVDVTGSPLDLCPEGEAFLGVRLPNGELAFTRDGRLKVSADGTLQAANLPVVDASGATISVPPGASPSIQPDGRVMVGGEEIARLGLFEMDASVVPTRLGPYLISGRGVPVQGSVRVGEIERSNAPAISLAMAMIAAQRHYESALQAVQTYKRLDDRANEIGRVR